MMWIHNFIFLLFFFTILLTIQSSHLIPYHVIIESTAIQSLILTFIFQHSLHIDKIFVLSKFRTFVQFCVATSDSLRIFVINNTMLKFGFHTCNASCATFLVIFCMDIFFNIHCHYLSRIKSIQRFRWSKTFSSIFTFDFIVKCWRILSLDISARWRSI